jgi:hypothetical protein
MARILVGLQEGTAVTEPKGELADLYVRHVPSANRLAFLLTGDRSQTEDLVHDAFVRCVGRFGHLRAHEAFDAYLRRTIVNLHTSRLRRVRVERAWLSKEAGRGMHGATAAMPDVAGREDMWRRLQTPAVAPAGRPGAALLRRPVGAGDGRCAAVLGRRREIADGARHVRAPRGDQK